MSRSIKSHPRAPVTAKAKAERVCDVAYLASNNRQTNRHGNSCPDMCSQCAGYADVKRVILDEVNHVLRINGKIVRQGQETPWYPRKRRKA